MMIWARKSRINNLLRYSHARSSIKSTVAKYTDLRLLRRLGWHSKQYKAQNVKSSHNKVLHLLTISASINVFPNGQEIALHLEPSFTPTSSGPIGPQQASMTDASSEISPSSPYTSQRTAVRNLTLPTNPEFDIPPSPPGSPTRGGEKFVHFLELKQEGFHFNAKLAASSALKNPSLLPKLMESAGLEGSVQYSTTLPLELWDPLKFPEQAYKEMLGKSQQEMTKKKEKERAKGQQGSIDFVSAHNPTQPSRGGAPVTSIKATGRSAAEKIMAGLDREGSVQSRNHADQ